MSVQHESPPSTAHHSHHHSGHKFPATPADIASPFRSDVTPAAADSYADPDALTALPVNSSSSADSSSMPPAPSHVAVTAAQPVQTSSPSVSSLAPAAASQHMAASSATSSPPTAPSTSPSSSVDSSAATMSSSSSSSSASLSAPSPSSSVSSAPSSSSSSSSPALSAIDRLRPSLQMYRNQVAGHSPLFWHSGTICKPLIQAEYTFYAQLEEQMPAFMPYVPKFYGLLDLEQLTEEMASSLLTESTDSSGNNNGASSGSTDRQRSGSGESSNNSEMKGRQSKDAASSHSDKAQKQSADEGSSSSSGLSRASSLSPPSASCSSHSMTANSSAGRIYNKWAMKCQLRKPGNSKSRIQYIVLEDLTYAYAKPCILDLKVGTRQHSDTEPPSKIASKTARCLHTTSHSLGLRLCGMQVYHPAEDMYQFRDKYWGRGLDVDGFKQAMRDYFWDGERIVEEVVRAFVARMEKMRRAVILWTKGRRFYSSSLLLVYEGDRSSRAGGSEQEASNTATTSSVSGLGELDKLNVLRQGSDSSLTSTGSGFFSPLPSPVTGASSASPGSNHRSSSGNQPLATSASMASLSTHERRDSINTSPLASSTNNLSALSSSVPSISTVPTTRATLPASFSSAALSSTFLSAQSNAASSSSTSSSSSSASAGSTPHSSSLHSAPIKLYSHKRKTTHAQAMALARQRGSIDVRIIDFAHTSVVGEAAVAGGVVEGGSADEVDSGLLFGFDCLLELLRGILEEEREKAEKAQEAAAEESDMQQSEQGVAEAQTEHPTEAELGMAMQSGSGTRVVVPADSGAVGASSDSGVSSAAPLSSDLNIASSSSA